MAHRLEEIGFDAAAGFGEEDFCAALRVFQVSAHALAAGVSGTRPAVAPSPGLARAARAALSLDAADAAAAKSFFTANFRPFRILPQKEPRGFLTGYYEPWVEGSPIKTAEFGWPILARPADLVSFAPHEAPPGFPAGVSGAQRLADGSLRPYPARQDIERAGRNPIVWLRDAVEAFLIQVQGSARVNFPDGRAVRLAYDGRNGQPYTSIGRILIESGEIAERDMSLAALKAWLRRGGLGEGERGLALMRANRSFVFFKIVADFDPAKGPIAGADVALTPLRSIAVDRAIWAYGTPFWIDAALPWRGATTSPFRRLTIAQDTGSAIVGPARADLFFGGGDEAGALAGSIRHWADFAVLLPLEDAP